MKPSRFLVVILLVAATAIDGAELAKKPAWRWTLAERLAVRNDPVAAAERVRDAELMQNAAAGRITAASAGGQADFIAGSRHAELLLPWELFDHMMGMAYADDADVRAIFRSAQRTAATASGLPGDFWTKLETITVAYRSDAGQLRDLHKRGVSDPNVRQRIAAESAALQTLQCRDRAAAIAAARAEFGEAFDRFLYEGVAPTMFIAVGQSGAANASRAQEIERGCR